MSAADDVHSVNSIDGVTDDSYDKKDKKKKSKKSAIDKNDPTRFAKGGIMFKAKLIGVETVERARGDKMCQEAMHKLKAAVKAAGEHKQRITINVSLDGIKISDDKSGSILHHHAVHRISFIARDAGDNRAFGYVYGFSDGKHEFFGIKTEKPAEGLVLTLRDLFQVVFEQKKREVELQKMRAKEESKVIDEVLGKEKDTNQEDLKQDAAKSTGENNVKSEAQPNGELQTVPVAYNLLDLESELSFLEKGIEQMDSYNTPPPSAGPGLTVSLPPVGQTVGHWNSSSSPTFPTLTPPPSSPRHQRNLQAKGTQQFPVTFNTPTAPQMSADSQSSQTSAPLHQETIQAGFDTDPFEPTLVRSNTSSPLPPNQSLTDRASPFPAASASTGGDVFNSDPFFQQGIGSSSQLDVMFGTMPISNGNDTMPQHSSPALSTASASSVAKVDEKSNIEFSGNNAVHQNVVSTVSDPFQNAPFTPHDSFKESFDSAQRQSKPSLSVDLINGVKLSVEGELGSKNSTSPELPSPDAPPPPLPGENGKDEDDLVPPPPPRPRPVLTKAQTIDIGMMEIPPHLPPRPGSHALEESMTPLPEVPQRLDSLPDGDPGSPRLAIRAKSSTPTSWTSSSPGPTCAISRARPRPRSRTPGGASTPTMFSLSKLPESERQDSFTYGSVGRRSDRSDTSSCSSLSRPRPSSTRSMLRNSSESALSKEVPENSNFSRNISDSILGRMRQESDVDNLSDKSSEQGSRADSFRDGFKVDPFALTEPDVFPSDNDIFSSEMPEQSAVFETKAVIFDADPFTNDPFEEDTLSSRRSVSSLEAFRSDTPRSPRLGVHRTSTRSDSRHSNESVPSGEFESANSSGSHKSSTVEHVPIPLSKDVFPVSWDSNSKDDSVSQINSIHANSEITKSMLSAPSTKSILKADLDSESKQRALKSDNDYEPKTDWAFKAEPHQTIKNESEHGSQLRNGFTQDIDNKNGSEPNQDWGFKNDSDMRQHDAKDDWAFKGEIEHKESWAFKGDNELKGNWGFKNDSESKGNLSSKCGIESEASWAFKNESESGKAQVKSGENWAFKNESVSNKNEAESRENWAFKNESESRKPEVKPGENWAFKNESESRKPEVKSGENWAFKNDLESNKNEAESRENWVFKNDSESRKGKGESGENWAFKNEIDSKHSEPIKRESDLKNEFQTQSKPEWATFDNNEPVDSLASSQTSYKTDSCNETHVLKKIREHRPIQSAEVVPPPDPVVERKKSGSDPFSFDPFQLALGIQKPGVKFAEPEPEQEPIPTCQGPKLPTDLPITQTLRPAEYYSALEGNIKTPENLALTNSPNDPFYISKRLTADILAKETDPNLTTSQAQTANQAPPAGNHAHIVSTAPAQNIPPNTIHPAEPSSAPQHAVSRTAERQQSWEPVYQKPESQASSKFAFPPPASSERPSYPESTYAQQQAGGLYRQDPVYQVPPNQLYSQQVRQEHFAFPPDSTYTHNPDYTQRRPSQAHLYTQYPEHYQRPGENLYTNPNTPRYPIPHRPQSAMDTYSSSHSPHQNEMWNLPRNTPPSQDAFGATPFNPSDKFNPATSNSERWASTNTVPQHGYESHRVLHSATPDHWAGSSPRQMGYDSPVPGSPAPYANPPLHDQWTHSLKHQRAAESFITSQAQQYSGLASTNRRTSEDWQVSHARQDSWSRTLPHKMTNQVSVDSISSQQSPRTRSLRRGWTEFQDEIPPASPNSLSQQINVQVPSPQPQMPSQIQISAQPSPIPQIPQQVPSHQYGERFGQSYPHPHYQPPYTGQTNVMPPQSQMQAHMQPPQRAAAQSQVQLQQHQIHQQQSQMQPQQSQMQPQQSQMQPQQSQMIYQQTPLQSQMPLQQPPMPLQQSPMPGQYVSQQQAMSQPDNSFHHQPSNPFRPANQSQWQ